MIAEEFPVNPVLLKHELWLSRLNGRISEQLGELLFSLVRIAYRRNGRHCIDREEAISHGLQCCLIACSSVSLDSSPTDLFRVFLSVAFKAFQRTKYGEIKRAKLLHDLSALL